MDIFQAFYFPPGTGYPIGSSDTVTVFKLEIHYDNPTQQTG